MPITTHLGACRQAIAMRHADRLVLGPRRIRIRQSFQEVRMRSSRVTSQCLRHLVAWMLFSCIFLPLVSCDSGPTPQSAVALGAGVALTAEASAGNAAAKASGLIARKPALSIDEADFNGANIKPLLTLAAAGTTTTVDIYRWNTGTYHFYSVAPTEGTNAGFAPEGARFKLYAPGMVAGTAIYRCYSGARHRLAGTACPAGYGSEGIVGYVRATPGLSGQALYSCYKAATDASLTTLDQGECTTNSYDVVATLGYTP